MFENCAMSLTKDVSYCCEKRITQELREVDGLVGFGASNVCGISPLGSPIRGRRAARGRIASRAGGRAKLNSLEDQYVDYE
jgi:hypothetical protein